MANYRFFKISEANSEIDRLTAELEKSQTALKQEQKKAADLQASVEELGEQSKATTSAEVTNLKAMLAAAEERATKAEASLADTQKQLAEANKKVEALPGEIEKVASIKAREITAAQGQPAVPDKPATTAATTGNPKAAKGLSGQERLKEYIASKRLLPTNG